MISAPELRATAALPDSRHAADLWQISLMASALAHVRGERAVAGVRAEPRVQRLRVCGAAAFAAAAPLAARPAGRAGFGRAGTLCRQSCRSRSGQVRFVTRPKSRTMRATWQLVLPPSTDF